MTAHFLVRGGWFSEADVLHDARGEQNRLLVDESDHVAAQPARIQRADVDSVDCYPALVDVVEAFQQAGHGRLASAGRADQGYHLSGGQLETEIA